MGIYQTIQATGQCPRCQRPVQPAGARRHADSCTHLPLPATLWQAFENGRSIQSLAEEYNASWQTIRERLELAGVLAAMPGRPLRRRVARDGAEMSESAMCDAIRATNVCPRCRCQVNSNIAKHAHMCLRLPLPDALRQEHAEGATISAIAIKYGVSYSSARNRIHSRLTPADKSCPICTIRIFADAAAAQQAGVRFVPHINMDMGGYCPGCAGADHLSREAYARFIEDARELAYQPMRQPMLARQQRTGT
ncbi:MAG: hypothetical protein D6816_03020 [Bacteroidetes bacterium]|nr:MAG: hypothetical protein D6816_03020 [Bacteroidota bacterium]